MENAPSIDIEEDGVICDCFQITESTIRSHIEKNDVIQVDDVTIACEAGGNCGSCHILIQLFIDQNKYQKTLKQAAEFGAIKSKNKLFHIYQVFINDSGHR